MKKTLPAANSSSSPARRRPARRVVRWLCLFFVMAVFTTFIFALYINKVGLPEFIKDPLVSQLRLKGLDVDFSRMRLRWHRGLVVEDLHLGAIRGAAGPQLFADEAQLRLDPQALRQRRLQVTGLLVNDGRLLWPLTVTNYQTQTLEISELGAQLVFHEPDRWHLKHLHGRWLNIDIELSGMLTNASALRFRRKTPRAPGVARVNSLRKMLLRARELRFSGQPVLRGHFEGNGRDLSTLHGDLDLAVLRVRGPWGNIDHLRLQGSVAPQTNTSQLNVQLQLQLERGSTDKFELGPLSLRVTGEPSIQTPLLTNVVAHLDVGYLRSEEFAATNFESTTSIDLPPGGREWPLGTTVVRLGSVAGHSATGEDLNLEWALSRNPTNQTLLQSSGVLRVGTLHSRVGSAHGTELDFRSAHSTNGLFPAPLTLNLHSHNLRHAEGTISNLAVSSTGMIPALTNLSLQRRDLDWPTRVQDIQLAVRATAEGIVARNTPIPHLSLDAQWEAPQFRLVSTNRIFGGHLEAEATLDTNTREIVFTGRSTCDAQRVMPLLATNTQRFLRKYTWKEPPAVQVSGRIRMPAWTNRQPDWRGEVLPTFSLAGAFTVGEGAYRNVPFASATSPFFLTNRLWHLPRLVVMRPEGQVVADYSSDQRNRDFHWKLRSNVDVNIARPLMDTASAQKIADYFEVPHPPTIEAEIWGRWRDNSRFGLIAHVAATNFTFRGESLQDGRSEIRYTNKFLSFLNPDLRRPGQHSTAAGVGADFLAKVVTITNAFGNLDPHVVGRAISRKAADVIKPYTFDKPPVIRASGLIDYSKAGRNTDLHFEIGGGPFHWRFFHLDEIMGNIAWVGRTLVLTNVQAQAHRGRLAGHAFFDFERTNGTTFSFQTTAAGLDLNSFVKSFSERTNKLEGVLNAELMITNALIADTNSWQGYGSAQLLDGLIWDIPVFGVFSPILNSMMPGLGNSRARQALAPFRVTNSVVVTDNLQIDATAMRMRYEGTVTFDGRIDGRMEAALLRNLPGVGFLVSKLFWPVTKVFEYRITGTLTQPKTEPLFFLPRVIFMPLQPIKTIRDLLPETPAPAAPPPPPGPILNPRPKN